MFDDHEFINNIDDTPTDETLYQNAIRAWLEYAGNGNPPSPSEGEFNFYFNMSYGDVDFFILDTRSFRDDNDEPDGPNHTLLGDQQRTDFLNWLGNSNAPFKVVGTGTPFALTAGDTVSFFYNLFILK